MKAPDGTNAAQLDQWAARLRDLGTTERDLLACEGALGGVLAGLESMPDDAVLTKTQLVAMMTNQRDAHTYVRHQIFGGGR